MKPRNLSVDYTSTLGEDLLKEVISRGFGSMNKNDYEVFLFDQLRKQGCLRGKSNYDISVALGIPESKVKRLDYEASLVYGEPSNKTVHNFLQDVFKNKKFKIEYAKGNIPVIKFSVDNKFLRSTIDAMVKTAGGFTDISFNTDMVVIYPDDFQKLLVECYEPNELARLEDLCQKELITVKDSGNVVNIDNNPKVNININDKPDNSRFVKVLLDFLSKCGIEIITKVLTNWFL